jgi:hypothetical protein
VLTEEIKDIVLKDHVYYSPKVINNTVAPKIVYKTTTSKFNPKDIAREIHQVDAKRKLSKLLQRKGKTLCDLQHYVSIKMACKTFENGDDITNIQSNVSKIVDELTQTKSGEIQYINILCEKKCQGIDIFLNMQWVNFGLKDGIDKVMTILKDCHLDHYEQYLIKNIYDLSNTSSKEKYEKLLEDYYRFILNFDLKPCIWENKENDVAIIGRQLCEDDSYCVYDHCRKQYEKCKKTYKKSDAEPIRRQICDSIKSNTISTIDKLDEVIVKQICDAEKLKQLCKSRN